MVQVWDRSHPRPSRRSRLQSQLADASWLRGRDDISARVEGYDLDRFRHTGDLHGGIEAVPGSRPCADEPRPAATGEDSPASHLRRTVPDGVNGRRPATRMAPGRHRQRVRLARPLEAVATVGVVVAGEGGIEE